MAGKFLWSPVAVWWRAMSAPPHVARRATSPHQSRALTNEPMTPYPVPSCHLPLTLSGTGTLFWSHQSMILTFEWMLDHFHPEIDVHFLPKTWSVFVTEKQIQTVYFKKITHHVRLGGGFGVTSFPSWLAPASADEYPSREQHRMIDETTCTHILISQMFTSKT